MIWVTWRQHRAQAIACLGVCCVIAIFAVVMGESMRSAFNSDGLPACLARSGGAACPAAITSFVNKFNSPVRALVDIPLFVVPVGVGIMVGGPLLGRELEQGTWRLAWSQTVSRTRWLLTKLSLVTGGLVVFGVVVTLLMMWYREPLDRISPRLQPPPFNYEGIMFTGSVLCAFGLATLAGLLLRNVIAAIVAGYIAWEVVSAPILLMSGPLAFPAPLTMRIPCHGACPSGGTNSTVPVTGHLGDLVLNTATSGHDLVVTYLPPSRFWTMQFIGGGLYLVVASAALGVAIWLLHRRTT